MPRSARWYSASASLSGEPLTLHDGTVDPLLIMKGVAGIEMPAFSVELEAIPGGRGTRFVRATAKSQTIKVPVLLAAPTRAQMRLVKEELFDALNPDANDDGGPGVLEISDGVGTNSGEVRRINAVYRGGLEGDEAAVVLGDGQTYWQFVLDFAGLDFWYSPEPVIAEWAGQAGVPFYPFRNDPFRLSPYGLTNTIPLDLPGNAKSWPTLKLSPPFSRIRVVNTRSGSWWQVGRGGDDQGAAVFVDGSPGSVRVRDSAGGNLFSQLTWGGPDPFGIRPGDALSLESDGAAVSTLVHLEVLPRWKSSP